ncbi:MAG: prenyltransferase [Bacillota bacterium]|jgi:1,4-dihydroxy-2-naphthoate octaprenyltransferase
MRNFLEAFRRFAAPPSWDASFTPMILGFTCAFTIGGAKLTPSCLWWMFAAFIAIALVETGKHALNEIMDFRSGDDCLVDAEHRTPFSGGKKVLPQGLITETQAFGIAVVTMGIACVVGVAIAFWLNWIILPIGIVGMGVAVLYNAPQTRLIYRGWGEPCIFIAYGPVCAMGAYYMFAEAFSWIPLLVSFSLGLLIVNVLIINEFPDYEADKAAGKRNWIVRLGKYDGLRLYALLYVLHFVPYIVLMFVTKSPLWVLTFATLPMFLDVMRNYKRNMDNVPAVMRSNADTITIHMRSGLLADAVVLMLWLMTL